MTKNVRIQTHPYTHSHSRSLDTNLKQIETKLNLKLLQRVEIFQVIFSDFHFVFHVFFALLPFRSLLSLLPPVSLGFLTLQILVMRLCAIDFSEYFG